MPKESNLPSKQTCAPVAKQQSQEEDPRLKWMLKSTKVKPSVESPPAEEAKINLDSDRDPRNDANNGTQGLMVCPPEDAQPASLGAANGGTISKAVALREIEGSQGPAPLALATLERPKPTETVTPNMAQELAICECVIAKFMDASWRAGAALAEILAKKLYREEFKTFENYTLARWNFHHSQANRLMEWARVMTIFLPQNGEGPKLPTPEREAQARPLTSLPQDKVIEVWAEVLRDAKGGRVTANMVSRAVRAFQSPSIAEISPSEAEPDSRDITPPSKFERGIGAIKEGVDLITAAAKDGLNPSEKSVLKKLGRTLTELFGIMTK